MTDAFAAALVLAAPPGLVCDYVGHLPAAKDYGKLRMHRLHRGTHATRSALTQLAAGSDHWAI